MPDAKVLLIGGTSNVGKSTLAEALAAKLGWDVNSTDRLGRHPGRPWGTAGKPVPVHVIRHYLALHPEDLLDAQLRHYERMWPGIVALIANRLSDDQISRGLVLEGSGVWPDRVAELDNSKIAAVFLTASSDTLSAASVSCCVSLLWP